MEATRRTSTPSRSACLDASSQAKEGEPSATVVAGKVKKPGAVSVGQPLVARTDATAPSKTRMRRELYAWNRWLQQRCEQGLVAENAV